MNQLVKYHNDFNKIRLPSFTEQEQNMLCGIFSKMRNKGCEEPVRFTPQELLKFSTERLTNKALGDLLTVLREKFFKANFTILIDDKERGLIGTEVINLFSSFKLWYNKDDVSYKNLLWVEMITNPRFEYILNDLKKQFTGFELEEFIALSGKYTKTLYRLLKQYRSVGKATFEWSEFLHVMDVPKDYKMCDIDKRILKPAVKELTSERNLFDQKRIPFVNLAYDKVKERTARGRGGKVIGITFTFKPENLEAQKIRRLNENDHFLEACYKLRDSQTRWLHHEKILQICDIDTENFIVQNHILTRDKADKLVKSGGIEFKFKSLKDLVEQISERIC